MRTIRVLTLIALAATMSVGAYAAKTKPAAKPAAAPAREVSPAEKTSALFYSVCAESMGNQVEFDKRMKSLADAKTVVKMSPDDLKGINADEAKDAWGAKGFTDTTKTILITYNAAANVCGLRVGDTDPTLVRHAFQADLKKLLDQTKGTVKVYPPQTKEELKVYGADIVTKDKTLQLGIAVSKSGEAFLTFHI